MAELIIRISEDLIRSFKNGKDVVLELSGPAGSTGRASRKPAARRGRRRKKRGSRTARSGALHSRVAEWAAARKKPFGTTEVMEAFGVSRGHASMLLSRLVKDRAERS